MEALVERGDDVRVVDNFSTGQPANIQSVAGRIEMIEGDLTDPDVAKRTCRGIEVVFHLAALPGVAISLTKPMDSIRHGLVTTANVLEAAREAGVRRLVYSSSASVYGGRGPFPQREDSTPHACSPYGATKVCSEVFLRTFCVAFSVDGVSLRYFNVFGP